MEKNYHSIKQRMENLRSIKPMLVSLRTISLSSWRFALKRMENLTAYRRDLAEVAGLIDANIDPPEKDIQNGTCLIVLGSTRGLCGGFNRDLLAFYQSHTAEIGHPSISWVFGEKASKLLGPHLSSEQLKLEYPRITRLSFGYISDLMARHNPQKLTCKILYNAYRGSGHYETILKSIDGYPSAAFIPQDRTYGPIIDTNVRDLSDYLFRQNAMMEAYAAFLSSQAAEHAFRFQIMENAISNTDDLLQELSLALQVERQKKITSEMRELSISAGLLDF